MAITLTKMHDKLKAFHLQYQRLPNTLLIPASEQVNEVDLDHIERVMWVKVVFAAVSEPTAAIL